MKYKYKKGQKVLVYHSDEWVGGGIGIIRSRDGLEAAYEIEDLCNFNEFVPTRWVREANIVLLNFEKPLTLWEKIKKFFRAKK